MRASYFRSPEHPLFGVFEEPATSDAGDAGVVLCYPYGPDYAIAFRSFRILGARLARAGFHVLRFDYLGTGDSSGDADVASIPQWIADVRSAMEEMQGSLGVRAVSLVGLRLGATLAAFAAAESKSVDRLVLWEPVVGGREYLTAQLALHRHLLQEAIYAGRQPRSADDEMLGCRLPQRLRRDLENLSLWSLAGAPARSVHILSKSSSPEYDRLADFLRKRGAEVNSACVEGPTIWSGTSSIDESSVPTGAMNAIVTWLASDAR